MTLETSEMQQLLTFEKLVPGNIEYFNQANN